MKTAISPISKQKPTRLSPKQARFLEALPKALGLIYHACAIAGVSRQSVNNWQKKSPAFARAMEIALKEANRLQLRFVATKAYEVARGGTRKAITMQRCIRNECGPAFLARVLAGEEPEWKPLHN